MSNDRQVEAHEPEESGEGEGPFSIQGYILLNVFFWAFCAAEVVIVRLWLKDTTGVIFFFGLLAVGFTAVSIYDCVSDRLGRRRGEADDGQPSTNQHS